MRARTSLTVLLALLLASPVLAGCLGADDPLDQQDVAVDVGTDASIDLSVYDRSGTYSVTLEEGAYGILESQLLMVPGIEGEELAAGVWLPDIPGCDWEAEELNASCQVPVVIEAGPYYGNGDVLVDEPAQRLGEFLITNLVPHGYAVVQLSVRGTGYSDGCNDFLGPKEQAGLDAAVTHFGEAAWSSGDVALIGRSYDGTTPFEAATFGNPHLKTIVPISGLSDVGDLYWRNGSSEWRAPFLGTVYSSFTVASDDRSPQGQAMVLCPETAEHPIFGASGYVVGGEGGYPAGDAYWADRNYKPRMLENYEGSVWIIHGLQDWNVDPHMVFPFANELEDAGIETKVWAGQWEHDYPDRPDDHDHLRWDWATELLAWFDQELKGDVNATARLGPAIQSEDNRGNWRALDAWPPRDVDWSTLRLAEGALTSDEEVEHGARLLLDPYGSEMVGEATVDSTPGEATTSLTFMSDALPEDTRIVGLPQLHVTVTPTTNGGQLYAELHEVTEDGKRILIGHAQMDLRYHAGGKTMQTVVPGEDVVARMELQPMDALVLEGSKLELTLRQSHLLEPLPAAQQSPVMVHYGGEYVSELRLPLGDAGGVLLSLDGVDPASTWG